MLEFFTAFGLSDINGAKMKFNAFAANFDQSQIVGGPPIPKPQADQIKAHYLFNTAFGFSDYFHAWQTPQNTVGVTMSVMFRSIGTNSQGELVTDVTEWFQILGQGQALMRLKMDGLGVMQVLPTAGASVGVLAQSFFYDTWYTLEIKSGVFGWEIRVNGVLGAKSSSPISDVRPDTAGFRRQGFGPPGIVITNYALWDDRAGSVTDFIGPVWISVIPLAGDVNTVWRPTPGPAVYAGLQDLADPFTPTDTNGSPDGDDSYAVPVSVSPPQLFTVYKSPCFGQVQAVAANVCGRPIGADQLVSVWVRPKRTLYNLGNVQLVPAGVQFTGGTPPQITNYATQQLISTASPESGTFWTDSEIGSGQWGLAPASSDNLSVRVTQFYLEKLTTLAAKPYSCGGAPYFY